MSKLYTQVSTRGMSREQWLEERRKGIGGSDAAAILGVSPYKSAYSIWADKMGYGQDEDNEAMRQGRDLEQYVVRRYAEKSGHNVVRMNAILVSREFPWMRANIDRRIIGQGEGFLGLECKTSKDVFLNKFKNGEYPIEYYAQCMHYMAVTGAERWYLAVVVYGTEVFTFEIKRDEEDIKRLIEAEEAFWKGYVATGVQPPTDGSKSTSEALKQVYPVGIASGLKTAADESRLEQLWRIKTDIKKLEGREKELENAIKAEMGEAELLTGIEYSASWKTQARKTFDSIALQKAYPELNLDTYYKTTAVRVFKLNYEAIDAGINEEAA